MNDGLAPTPSLLGRVRQAARGLRFDRSMRLALAIALLLAAAPALTLAGARMLEGRVRADIAARARDAADSRNGAGTSLARLVARPGVGGTVEALARAMPEDARLVSVERDASGGLRVELAAPDPDRVRAALRASPDTRAVRDAGQRGADGAMIVAFEDRP